MLLENKNAVSYGAAGTVAAEVADTAASIASDHAGAMTATVANLSAGSITD
jgi:hypothetical protein